MVKNLISRSMYIYVFYRIRTQHIYIYIYQSIDEI